MLLWYHSIGTVVNNKTRHLSMTRSARSKLKYNAARYLGANRTLSLFKFHMTMFKPMTDKSMKRFSSSLAAPT
jgi:hypothetical protein